MHLLGICYEFIGDLLCVCYAFVLLLNCFAGVDLGQPQYFLSRERSWIASAMCCAQIISLLSRSAMVLATRRILS